MSKRMGYRAAIQWLASNDDSSWAEDDAPQSVTAAFVADCYGVDDEKVRRDLRRCLAVHHLANRQAKMGKP